jgi:hypothetical protein
MIGSHVPKFKRTVHYWPYWFVGRRSRDRPRLWPYVLTGLLMALCLWAYFEPIPEHTTLEPIGPSSSLYGPLR